MRLDQRQALHQPLESKLAGAVRLVERLTHRAADVRHRDPPSAAGARAEDGPGKRTGIEREVEQHVQVGRERTPMDAASIED